MKSVYIFFLLAALIFTDFTPANATPLKKRWQRRPRPCCPVSRCVFNQGDTVLNRPGFSGNTFNGFLEFTQSPRDTLEIAGNVNIAGVVNGAVEALYDIHVANCDTATTNTPGDPATINLDFASFDKPILTSLNLPISRIRDQCCFVVEESAANRGSVPRNERILGIARVTRVNDCPTRQ
ncbi:1149_t:CDS:1 [Paraglomus occultum]|uniref:1149_t:CDS:1 n=1 Tax=Paraglomus occultum TaxID=144539 RepID=A0A9N9AI40_9GLOM|nr:1149_t:CDS:1 [Paraglomus occultum]